MGDERPAEFAMEIQRLVASASMDDMMKRVFIRCLPKSTVTAITSSLGGKFQTVAQAADKAWTAAAGAGQAPVSVSAVSTPQVQTAKRAFKGAKRGGRQPGTIRASGQIANVALCSFHRKFGDAARKCANGCSRWGEDRTRDAPTARVLQVQEALDGEDAQEDTASENL